MNQTIKQPLSAKSYLLITIFGLLLSICSLVVFIAYSDYLGELNLRNQIFYLILLLFGISVSAFIFGAMNSYASLTGKKYDTKFNLTGPIVGIVLTVAGGFYFPGTAESEIVLSVRLYDYNAVSLKTGEVKLYLGNDIQVKAPDKNGQALFFIPGNKTGKIKIEATSAGYKNESRELSVSKSTTVDISMGEPKYFKLFGKVKNADEYPIAKVEINIEDTGFYTQTATDGTFSLAFSNKNIGDEIAVITSHPKYKDKIIQVTITEINQELNIVLSPVP